MRRTRQKIEDAYTDGIRAGDAVSERELDLAYAKGLRDGGAVLSADDLAAIADGVQSHRERRKHTFQRPRPR